MMEPGQALLHYRVVTSLGGDNRYFFFDWIWTLREAADWLVGGPGFTRGRRHPVSPRGS